MSQLIYGTYTTGDEVGWCPNCAASNSKKLGQLYDSSGIPNDVHKCENCNTLFKGGAGSILQYTTTNASGFVGITDTNSNIGYITPLETKFQQSNNELSDIKDILTDIKTQLIEIAKENVHLKNDGNMLLKRLLNEFNLK